MLLVIQCICNANKAKLMYFSTNKCGQCVSHLNITREERAIKPESILDHYNTESTPIIKDVEQASVDNSECKFPIYLHR